MSNWVLNTPLYFEMGRRNIELGASCLNSLLEVFFKKKEYNNGEEEYNNGE